MKLFKPTATDSAALKLGREKLRKYGFTADHVPYLTAYNYGDKLMTDETTHPGLKPLVSAPKKVTKKTPAKAAKEARAAPKAKTLATTPVKSLKKTPISTDGKTSLKAICQKLKLDPKAARVKLRRNADKLGFHNTTDRWMFTDIQAAKVEEILSTSK